LDVSFNGWGVYMMIYLGIGFLLWVGGSRVLIQKESSDDIVAHLLLVMIAFLCASIWPLTLVALLIVLACHFSK